MDEDLFRRLCRYYRDCLRFDEHDSLRFRAGNRGDSWATVAAELLLQLGEHDEAQVKLPPSPCLSGLLHTARVRADWCWYAGYPLLQEQQHGQDWLIPLLLIPISLEEQDAAVCLRRCGPLLPNRAALQFVSSDMQEQQAICEAAGLTPAELGMDGHSQPRYDAPLQDVIEQLRSRGVLPLSGIRYEGLLGITRRGQYHRRLSEELQILAQATSIDALRDSALPLVFCDAANSPPQGPQQESQQPIIWERPLDPDQRRAVQQALEQPLTVVTGPPGCGKSVVVRQVLLNQALRGRPTLLASRNHRALDAVEPLLNALGEGETLVVRTSGHGHQQSWRHGLQELLDSSHSALSDVAAKQDAYEQALRQVARQEADLACIDQLAAAFDAADQAWQEALQAVPLNWRNSLVQDPHCAPSLQEVAQWRQRLQELQPPGLRQRLLPPGAPARCRRICEEVNAYAQRLGPGQAMPPPTAENSAVWQEYLRGLEAAAKCAEAWQQRCASEQRLRALPVQRDQLLRKTLEAHGRAWQAALALLREQAAAPPVDEAQRQTLYDLRAGISSFGLQRWSRMYEQCFPLLLQQRPLWAVSNLSAPATLPRCRGIFDLLVIDEASQCDIPSIIPLLFRCRRVLVVGDPQQLGHISSLAPLQNERLMAAHGLLSLSVQRYGYRSTSAYALCTHSPAAPAPILLSDHYRCHPSIARLINRAFYRQRLQVRTELTALCAPRVHGPGVHWHHCDAPLIKSSHGAAAPGEINQVLLLVQQLQDDHYVGSIGVVTPFRQQMQLIQRRLEAQIDDGFRQRSRLLVSTAHGFQGDERDCLIFSLCAGPGLGAGAARFLAATPNLFNVALSRARATLHIVGNRDWAAASGLRFIRELAQADLQPQDPAELCESPMESSLREALLAVDIHAQPQYPLAGRRIDLAVIRGDKRLAIEVDGRAHHATAGGQRSDEDHWRDLILTHHGWQVLRFWAHDIRDHCADCVAQVAAILDQP